MKKFSALKVATPQASGNETGLQRKFLLFLAGKPLPVKKVVKGFTNLIVGVFQRINKIIKLIYVIFLTGSCQEISGTW